MAAVLSCDCLSHRMNADGTLTERKLHVNPRPLVLRVSGMVCYTTTTGSLLVAIAFMTTPALLPAARGCASARWGTTARQRRDGS